MRAYSTIHLVVIHLGFTRFRNALEKTPAGMVPSPAEYHPELPRGVAADAGNLSMYMRPLAARRAYGPLGNWLGGAKRKSPAVADEGTQERHASRR